MSDAGESGFRGDESSIPSTASTHLMENTTGGKAYDLSGSVTSSAPGSLVGSAPGSSIVGSTNASGPGSAAGSGSGVGMSRSAMAASRLLRSRGGPRTKAAQQLMERLVPSSRAGAAAKNDDSSKETEPGKEKDKEPSKAAAAAARSSLRARVKSRRLAGGAYAKTMLNGKDKVDDSGKGEGAKEEEPAQEETTPTDDVDLDHIQEVTKAASAELDDARKQAVDEFARGTTHNTRYHALTRLIESHDDDEDMSEASMPSVLNRSEIFHENAAAAVMALLTPRRSSDAASQMTSHSLDEAGLKVTNTKKGLMITAEHQKTSAFRGPRSPATNGIDISASCVSGLSSQLDISYEGAVPQSPITNPILSVDAERALNAVKRRMMDPSKTLSDLLQAIATPEDGSIMDRGFMVRRKNACGAIKVLAATGSNRRTMCWTAGVLPALTSVLADTGDEGLLESFPNSRTRAEYFEARKRAVATLVNLSIPKENRIPIFHSPGLVQAVVCVINDDREEARQGCCALIAYLCKTAENRLLMTQVPGLLSAVGGVISPPKPDEHPISQIKPRKKYHWDDDDTETSNEQEDSFSTADDRNTSSDSYDRYTVTDGESSMRDSRTFDEEGSEVTPRAATMSFESRRQVFPHYDKDPNKWLHASRQNVFAAMLHLVKEKDNAVRLLTKNQSRFCQHSVVHTAWNLSSSYSMPLLDTKHSW